MFHSILSYMAWEVWVFFDKNVQNSEKVFLEGPCGQVMMLCGHLDMKINENYEQT